MHEREVVPEEPFIIDDTFFVPVTNVEQGGVPLAVTGIATGIVSVIGYTPDIFMPVLGGMILDANPGADGYQNLFLLTAALSFVGLIAAYIVYRKIQVSQAAGTKQDSTIRPVTWTR